VAHCRDEEPQERPRKGAIPEWVEVPDVIEEEEAAPLRKSEHAPFC